MSPIHLLSVTLDKETSQSACDWKKMSELCGSRGGRETGLFRRASSYGHQGEAACLYGPITRLSDPSTSSQ